MQQTPLDQRDAQAAFIGVSSRVPTAAIGPSDHNSVQPFRRSPRSVHRQPSPSAPRRRRRPLAGHWLAALGGLVGLSLLVSACGGSPGSHVAHLRLDHHATCPRLRGSQNTGSTNSHSPTAQPLAFSHCMRANGVSNFPDPNNSGVLPKIQVARLAASDPQFVPAHRACEHLLPNGGQPTPAQVGQAWNDMRNFARCMRSQGVQAWPEADRHVPGQDNRPFFQCTGQAIDPKLAEDPRPRSKRLHADVFHADKPACDNAVTCGRVDQEFGPK